MTDRDLPPAVGPFASREWDAAAGRWRLRLTADGRDRLTAWAADWPKPAKLLAHAWPALTAAARASGLGWGELNSLCRCAAVRAMLHYDPTHPSGSQFSTFASWRMRAAVCRAVRDRVPPDGVKVLPGDRPFRTAADGGGMFSVLAARADPSLDPNRRDAADALRRKVAGVLDRRVPSFRYREVFALRHGLHDGRPLTLEQVGAVFSITKERVRQIELRVIERTRGELLALYAAHHRPAA